MSRSRRWHVVFTVLAVAGFAACDVSDPFSTSDEQPLMEGNALAGATDVAYDSELEWAADGGEIFYEAGDRSLRASSTTQAGTRIIDTVREHFEITAASSSRAVYFVADRVGNRSSIYRAANGQTTQLSASAPATNPLGTVDGQLVLSGPGDEIAAYIVAPDSLFAYRTATGDRHFITTGCVRIVVFSPTGDHLICRRDGPRAGGYATIEISTGASNAILAVEADPGTTPRLVRWHDAGVRLLFSAAGRFRIRSIPDRASVALWQPPIGSGPRSIDFVHYAWSNDGSAFAFWAHECLQLNNQGNCEHGQSILHIIDLATNTGRTALVVKGSRGAEQVAFSADGRSVAYVFEGRVWIRPLF